MSGYNYTIFVVGLAHPEVMSLSVGCYIVVTPNDSSPLKHLFLIQLKGVYNVSSHHYIHSPRAHLCCPRFPGCPEEWPLSPINL